MDDPKHPRPVDKGSDQLAADRSDADARKVKAPRATKALAVDAWLDSTLYEAGFKARERAISRNRDGSLFRERGRAGCLAPAALTGGGFAFLSSVFNPRRRRCR